MFVYWGIFAILAVGSLMSQKLEKRPGLIFVLWVSVPTTLMIGFRWKVGTDWISYLEIFNYTKLYSLQQMLKSGDRGFNILVWVLHQFHSPFWMLNTACAIIFISGLSAFCLRQPNPWLAFLVAFPYLVLVIGMSGDRQAIALGFAFFALNAFERARLFRFVFLVFVAGLFHGSVLLIIPICLLSHTRSKLQRALLLIVALMLAYYYFSNVFGVYARRYTSSDIQSSGAAYRFAMNASAALFFLTFRQRFRLEEHLSRLWRNISVLTLCLGPVLLVFPSSTAIDRFLLYLFPLQFVVLSRIPTDLMQNRLQRGQAALAVISYAAVVQFTFLTFGTFASEFVPYRSILSL